MEAITGVSVGLLTIWDMVKAVETDENGQYPDTKISEIIVVTKSTDKEQIAKIVDKIGITKPLYFAQGGDTSIFENPEILRNAKYKKEILSNGGGYINAMPADKVGRASMLLGGGRATKEDSIDHFAGIELAFGYGTQVNPDDIIGYMYSSKNSFEAARNELRFTLTDNPPIEKPLIYDIL